MHGSVCLTARSPQGLGRVSGLHADWSKGKWVALQSIRHCMLGLGVRRRGRHSGILTRPGGPKVYHAAMSGMEANKEAALASASS